ncbi:MAG TPA: 16S rRNA (cytosine(1402)-N(4))-methyltransferase RsmH [Pseudomonadales bacterium]|nr:16S rRNA (cytosine(1402)-N(4))-methyltransferase RsmH [Pseudomonadales bacterium]
MSEFVHATVLLHEAIDSLVVNPAGVYIDGTYGRGGHSELLMSRLSGDGRLLAFDRDPVAVAHARERHANNPRFDIEQCNFSDMRRVVNERNLLGKVDGILLDIGVSSPQLDDAERGFSFMQDGPLDMRMNPQAGISAAEWINNASVEEMTSVFREYGEERYAKRIAGAIEKSRNEIPFTRTLQLAEVVTAANPAWEKHKHPATRVFQAIRIFINDELGELKKTLVDALDILGAGGRIAVIAFHSLEDRIVKQFFREQSRGREVPRHIPVTGDPEGRTLKLIGKAIKATDKEVAENPRSRSAVLRIAEKLYGLDDGARISQVSVKGIRE